MVVRCLVDLHLRVESGAQLHPGTNPCGDVGSGWGIDDPPMTTTDYLIDSALVLLVLLQIKERPMTRRQLIRPLIILGVAVASYLHGIPTRGNDLPLLGVFAVVGGLIGIAS